VSALRLTTEADLAKLLKKKAPANKQQSRSKSLQAELKRQIELAGLGPVVCELKFHKTRNWRLDIAIPSRMIAIEIEGGIFLKTGGRHNRGAGMRNDMEKYAEAVIAGWRLIRIVPEWIKKGIALDYVRRAASQET
jgi:hypothetical protein